MKKVFFVIFLYLYCFANAQVDVEQVLEEQLKKGQSGLYNESFDIATYKYSEKDLNAIIPILKNELRSSGFVFIDTEIFNDKIKTIFGRIIDNKLPSKYLYLSIEDKCQKNIEFYTNTHTIEINPFSYYIVKRENFLTELYAIPQIINYRKLYPEIAKSEDLMNKKYINENGDEIILSKWRESEESSEPEYNLKNVRKKNLQTLVARNMYLFNDSKAHFRWLVLNDGYFMESLVKKFGWTKDEKLLKWVIEKTPYNKNNPQDYGSLFWTKQCDGKVKLHANTFKLLHRKYTDPNEPKTWIILDEIQDYIEYLGNNEQSKSENLSAVDRVKILANMAYFAEQYKYDKDYKDNSQMMGRLRYFLNSDDEKILNENNYFGLPKFKEWWDNADYDEYVVDGDYNGEWGRYNEPLNYSEWRKKHQRSKMKRGCYFSKCHNKKN